MSRWLAVVTMLVLLAGCGLLPIGEGGISWPMPGDGSVTSATAEFPVMGTFDVDAWTLAPKAEGTIVDQYGAAMAGAILCVGPSEGDAVPLGETDATGAYSVTLDAETLKAGSLMLWPFLPLTRFEPEGYNFEGVLLGGSDHNFVGFPAIYPVPPEKDCR